NNPADAGASFSYATTTLYVQDDLYVTDDIQLMVGLRYDMWSSDDRPTQNANFTERYGFSNTANVDGIKLLQPRLGFNWAVADDLEVRGGVGLYAGGNPNVWISNAYSNDGVTNIGLQDRTRNSITTAADGYLTGAGRPIYDIPQALFDAVAATSIADGNGNVNATDPSFDIPSEWKYSLGATYITPNDYVITADIMYTDKQNSATVVDLGLTPSGFTAVDGRPLYETSTTGRYPGSDFMLTNVNSANDGDSTTISASIQKDWENGFNGMLAYAYTEATDANPMTSSVAYSNFINVAVADVNSPQAATSDYEIPHRFTMKFGYTTELFDGYNTSFNLYATASDGKPYSATFSESGGDLFGFDSSSTRGLVYIPEVNDAGVVYGSGFDQAAFDDFIAAEGLTRGAILGRNSFNAEWWSKVDIRISQELPGFVEGHKASAFFVIENFTNMLNDDWGVLRQGSFVGEQIVNAHINDAGQYVYESFNAPETSYVRGPSLWEVRVGVKYSF
ncbi:MAG: TonB-dependent receptor, partial [Glaciecola sp.]|nr:TonB-dependent receptor [Glaciecola sp.]